MIVLQNTFKWGVAQQALSYGATTATEELLQASGQLILRLEVGEDAGVTTDEREQFVRDWVDTNRQRLLGNWPGRIPEAYINEETDGTFEVYP
jgi:hypothetical protein